MIKSVIQDNITSRVINSINYYGTRNIVKKNNRCAYSNGFKNVNALALPSGAIQVRLSTTCWPLSDLSHGRAIDLHHGLIKIYWLSLLGLTWGSLK